MSVLVSTGYEAAGCCRPAEVKEFVHEVFTATTDEQRTSRSHRSRVAGCSPERQGSRRVAWSWSLRPPARQGWRETVAACGRAAAQPVVSSRRCPCSVLPRSSFELAEGLFDPWAHVDAMILLRHFRAHLRHDAEPGVESPPLAAKQHWCPSRTSPDRRGRQPSSPVPGALLPRGSCPGPCEAEVPRLRRACGPLEETEWSRHRIILST